MRVESIRVSTSFLSDILQAQDGSLMWLDISGIARLDWPPRWRIWSESEGGVPGAYELAEFDGRLFASTWGGSFVGPMPSADAPLAFVNTRWTDEEAWALHRHGDALLFAESKHLLRVDVSPPVRLSGDDLYPRVFLDDPQNPDWLWVGTEHGPALFERDGEGYRMRHRDRRLGWLVNALVAHDGAIWASDGVGGVRRLARGNLDPAAFSFERAGPALGLPAGELLPAQLSEVGDQLIASTAQGLFRYANGRFEPDRFDGLADLLDEGETVTFREAADRVLWAHSYHSVYRRDASGQWSLSMLGGLHTGAILSLLPRPGGEALVSVEAGVLQHRDAELPAVSAQAPRPRVASARVVRGAHQIEALALAAHPQVQLDGGSLEFEFAYPRFDGVGVSEFQFSIDPLGANWSSWSNRASATLLALPAGDYALQLRARSRYGSPVQAEPFEFTVVPRWYERAWVWPLAVFVAGSLLALALIQRQRNKVRRLRERNLELDELVHQRTRELESVNVQLRGLAESDGLTGIANRRHFDEAFALEMERAQVRGEALSLLLLDVDHFKQYNDSHGHQAGDDVLRTLAVVMRESVRPDTLVARYGGEEFAVVATHCDAAQARDIAARICARLATRLGEVTLSIGIATRTGQTAEGPEILIARADAALYRAKHKGRNRIESDLDAIA
jgi:diguanylate cyclase (GGDEF)-like protein